MARSRMLRPQFFSDPQFCRLSMGAQHLCLGLIPQLDRNGVFYGHPQTVKSHIFPHATKMRCSDVERWLKELHDAARVVGCRHKMPRIRLFSYAGTDYLIDLNFALHQRVYPDDPDIYGIPVETRLRVDHDLVEEQRQLTLHPLNLNLNLNLNHDAENEIVDNSENSLDNLSRKKAHQGEGDGASHILATSNDASAETNEKLENEWKKIKSRYADQIQDAVDSQRSGWAGPAGERGDLQ